MPFQRHLEKEEIMSVVVFLFLFFSVRLMFHRDLKAVCGSLLTALTSAFGTPNRVLLTDVPKCIDLIPALHS